MCCVVSCFGLCLTDYALLQILSGQCFAQRDVEALADTHPTVRDAVFKKHVRFLTENRLFAGPTTARCMFAQPNKLLNNYSPPPGARACRACLSVCA